MQLPAWIPACIPAYLPAYILEFFLICIPTYLYIRIPAQLPPCIPALLQTRSLAFQYACLPACFRYFVTECSYLPMPAYQHSCMPAFLYPKAFNCEQMFWSHYLITNSLIPAFIGVCWKYGRIISCAQPLQWLEINCRAALLQKKGLDALSI